ncbi:MAG: class I SAM-dependent methyltransferase [Undibacterium sp.]|nr:class I SAM-dependent methyltransferase [Undibacterium sp.]MDO9193110.1 class I SAM-dependent methyltransferase [Undibacterium sp.]
MIASPWVCRFLPLIPKNQGPVLDLACGSGRHSRLLLDAGYDVWALDKDASLLAPLALLGARCFPFDLEAQDSDSGNAGKVNWPFDPDMFSAIIVTNYLYRPLLSMLTFSLKEQGILIYETFAAGNEVFGRPRSRDFLLQPGELIDCFLSEPVSTRKNQCIAYEHGQINNPKPAIVQRICLRSISVTSTIDASRDHLDGI